MSPNLSAQGAGTRLFPSKKVILKFMCVKFVGVGEYFENWSTFNKTYFSLIFTLVCLEARLINK